MDSGLLADAVLLLHGLFIGWALLGGFAAVWRPWVAVAHLPALAWGVWIETSGGICPLTPLENSLRRAAGEVGYRGGFVEHYLGGLIYPAGLTRDTQWLAAGVLVVVNLVAYGLVIARVRRSRR